MKATMFGAVLFALACILPARAADVREQTYSIGADVDAQGRITALQFDDESAAIRKLLSGAATQWRFAPARRDGRPVPAHTFIDFRVRAIPDAQGQYALRVIFVGNGPRLDRATGLKYPPGAVRRRQSAFMLLEATVQPDGSLADLKISPRYAEWPVAPSFEEAVRAGAKRWRATSEQVEGQPVATRLRIPVSFTMGPEYFTEDQVRILRAAASKEAAERAAENARAGVPLPSNDVVALDSPLQPQAATVETL